MQKQEKIPPLTTAANLKEEIRVLEAALARKELEILVMEAQVQKEKESGVASTPKTRPK